MGYTTMPMHEPVKDWFKREWERNENIQVLDIAIVHRTKLYAAIQYKDSKKVFAAIYLLSWSPKSYYNFGYKDMDETVMPYYFDCPEKILKLLTPTDNEYANKWRSNVAAYHKMRKILNKKSTVVKFDKPINFNNNYSYQFFKKEGNKLFTGDVINNEFKNRKRVRMNIIDHMEREVFEFIEIKN